ncbi:MAG: DUF2490 domain-containing protein [Bacteroidia bacterium]
MKLKRFITLLLSVSSVYCSAQPGSWNIIHVKTSIDSLWQVLAEAQVRSLSFYNEFHYYEYKGAVTYSLAPTRKLTAGLGSYRTFLPDGNFRTPAAVKEIRSWIELSLNDPGKLITLDHRYRVEQRYTNLGYRNRFRYRFGGLAPLNKTGNFFIAAWGELFFTNRAPYFERIRSYVGPGLTYNNVTIQLGFLNQFDYKISDETGRNFIQVSFRYNLSNKRFRNKSVPFQEG